jgi:hypothetical protein
MCQGLPEKSQGVDKIGLAGPVASDEKRRVIEFHSLGAKAAKSPKNNCANDWAQDDDHLP